MNILKTFMAAVVIFIVLYSISWGLAAISRIEAPFVFAVFALAMVAYLLSDEVVNK